MVETSAGGGEEGLSPAERILFAASKLPPEARAAFVRAECGDDHDLLNLLFGLLPYHKQDDFLRPPGDATLLQTFDDVANLPDSLEGHVLLRRYELGEMLGRGASGGVYRGRDRVTGAPVAVKVMGTRTVDSTARYELASLRYLRVQGVVALLDDGVDDTLGICLVMELVEGTPFGSEDGAKPWPFVRRALLALLDTLARIHARGLVHKDLKPHNVLVDEHGIPTVLDLGISSVPQGKDSDKNVLMGTPAYMAPEVANGALPDERSDLHAVGLMAVEMLTGHRLYRLPDDYKLFWAKRGMHPLQVDGWLLDERIPEEARPLLASLLQPDPAQRPATAREARAQLEPMDGFRHPAVAAGTEEALRSLFLGVERVFRIPSDAAHELFRRTDGDPRAVQAELDAWEGARLGVWEKDGFHIRRPQLEELRAGLHPRVPATSPQVPRSVAGVGEILPYARALPDLATPEIVATAARLDVEVTRGALEALVEARILESPSSGRYRLNNRGLALPLADDNADVAGRLANAWPAGLPGRMSLLLAAGREPEVAAECLAAVDRAMNEGTLHDVGRLAEMGLRAGPDPEVEYRLLIWLMRVSIPMTAPAPIEAALARVERSGLPPERREFLQQIGAAALLLVRREVRRAWEALPEYDDARPRDELSLEVMVRLHLIRHLPPEQHEPEIRKVVGEPESASDVAGSSAWAWHYLLTRRWKPAVDMFQRQIAACTNENARLSAYSNAGYAHLLAYDFEAALDMYERVMAAAIARRVPHFEAHTIFDRRRVNFVQGRTPVTDAELVAIIEILQMGTFLEYAYVCESGVAWRNGDLEHAGEWLGRACSYLGDETRKPPDPVTRAFYAYLCPKESPDTGESLRDALGGCDTPEDVAETIAFMAMRDTLWVEDLKDRFRAALAEIPRETWKYRRMVLSVDEAVKSVLGNSQV